MIQQKITVYTVDVYVANLETVECFSCEFFNETYKTKLDKAMKERYPHILEDYPYILTYDADTCGKNTFLCMIDDEAFNDFAIKTSKRIPNNVHRTVKNYAYTCLFYNAETKQLENFELVDKNEKQAYKQAARVLVEQGLTGSKIIELSKVGENSGLWAMPIGVFFDNAKKYPVENEQDTETETETE